MHSFHIPVMGLGFTIDTPVKTAQYGISSVISIVDDSLIEKMREFYSKKLGIPYSEISVKVKDFRAKRITSYLNMIDDLVREKFLEVKNSILSAGDEIHKYVEMLPDFSGVKKKFYDLLNKGELYRHDLHQWIHNNLKAGDIDVNIMTKLDSPNYLNKEKLPIEFNDAHAALRGFAKSNLTSSIILSAGINPALYSYMENFEDFYPSERNKLIKKITLKVSDYRSAIIQGKFLAKKGLWVSEYRIESGLNCGGHAFATDGFLMGPILEEFKNKRLELLETTHNVLCEALKSKDRYYPQEPLKVKITAQGGVGTTEEHNFLLEHYGLDSVGWGTPFLLVPEVVNIDDKTLQLLKNAEEKDLYLSNISPLGVPFNSLRNNTQDIEKNTLIEKGRPGSSCPKKYLTFNTEYTEVPICTASRQYQNIKITELEEKKLSAEDYNSQYEKIVDKSCLCVGLSNPAIISNGIEVKGNSLGVSVCPGPNMAYFNKVLSLREMVDHIYGRINVIDSSDRPHMFLKELKVYIEYLKKMIDETVGSLSEKQIKYFQTFQSNLNNGIEYYKKLFSGYLSKYEMFKENILHDLEKLSQELNNIEIEKLALA